MSSAKEKWQNALLVQLANRAQADEQITQLRAALQAAEAIEAERAAEEAAKVHPGAGGTE